MDAVTKVSGDAEGGWLVEVHDGDNAATYSPDGATSASEAEHIALQAHALAFPPTQDDETINPAAVLAEIRLTAENIEHLLMEANATVADARRVLQDSTAQATAIIDAARMSSLPPSQPVDMSQKQVAQDKAAALVGAGAFEPFKAVMAKMAAAEQSDAPAAN